MQKKNIVSSVADIFGLNASALRFWEKEGLIRFERDAENNYRLPTLSAVEDIWEIVFLKNLALSAKQIREILRACPEDIKSILADNENRLKGEIEKLQTALYKLEQKKRMLDVFFQLDGRPLYIAKAREMRSFPVYETTKEIMRCFLKDETCSAAYCERGKAPINALILDDEAFLEKYGRRPQVKRCVHGLLRVEVERRDNNNAAEFFSFAEENGMAVREITGRFLFTALEKGARREFYDAYAFED